MVMHYVDYRLGYLHGGEKGTETISSPQNPGISQTNLSFPINNAKMAEAATKDPTHVKSEWRSTETGGIPCPRGCGEGVLELKCMFEDDSVAELLLRAEKLAFKLNLEGVTENFEQGCSCVKFLDENASDGNKLRKAASREDSVDNFLYCPMAQDLHQEDLKHFQWHWSKGEPVIVSNVLEKTYGLSWDPYVMWRACREVSNRKRGARLNVVATNCLSWCEVSIKQMNFNFPSFELHRPVLFTV